MIDLKKVKAFWDGRSSLYQDVAFESIVNLEHDSEMLKIKISAETDKVFSWLSDLKNKSILDLGAGVGQWSFRFTDKGAKQVVAVEYSADLVRIGREEARQRNYQNVEFVISNAEDFHTTQIFDVIFISGLCVYLNDEQISLLVNNLKYFSDKHSSIILREGTGVNQRFEITNKYSENLKTEYSAVYRTTEEYITIFKDAGFHLIRNENMFPEGHSLNKYPETRLHIFQFEKI